MDENTEMLVDTIVSFGMERFVISFDCLVLKERMVLRKRNNAKQREISEVS